jgi:Xaa-Pro aminopeptidase
MLEAYEEYFEAARDALKPGATAHDVHRAVSKGFTDRGYHLGHVTGHSIGMTMLEFPKIGEGVETSSRRTWSFRCIRTRSPTTARVPLHAGHLARHADGGEPLAGIELKIY